jgi:CRP-like cAMP-binding protein
VADELSKILLLKDCPEEVLTAITKAVKEQLVPPKKYIFRQGERGKTFYVVVSGQVEITQESDSGRPKRIAVLSAGDAFGEIALLENVPRTASVRSVSQCTLLSLSRQNFAKLILPHVGVEKFTENLQKRAFLARIPLCHDWHPQALQHFAVDSVMNHFKEDMAVVREKQENHFFYIVYKGSFDVKRKKKKLATLKPGDFFGEISLLQSSIGTADVVAREDSACISVHRNDFLNFIGKDFLIGMQIESVSSKRLKHPVFPLDVRSYEAVD